MRYLFRLDMARDNEEFMNLRRARHADHVYAGSPMKIGPGWIPDFLELEVDPAAGICRLTLLELEATETPAKVSCRKYLPESSSEILRAFRDYLGTVVAQCRATADPRLEAFEELKDHLANAITIRVHTAAALRSSPGLIEDLALMDQPDHGVLLASAAAQPAPSRFSFNGDRRLTRAECDGLRRSIRIIHAVFVGLDHSGGTIKSWRNRRTKPLDRAVANDSARFPQLHKLLASKTTFGVRLNCDKLAAELALLWDIGAEPITPKVVAGVMETFLPVAVTFAMHEPMQKVFEKAREVVRANLNKS